MVQKQSIGSYRWVLHTIKMTSFCHYLKCFCFDTILVLKEVNLMMVTTTIRIDEDLYNAIVKLASEEERSINSQIIYMLKNVIKQNSKEKVGN